jgi:biotin-(acetyl-CoA carboxylase) ligase
MNLYYEDVPADDDDIPQLPPLLQVETIDANDDVLSKAVTRAAAGEIGLVCYSSATHILDMAITLVPEVPMDRATQMAHTAMIALSDSIGALAPPEVNVRFRFPGDILLNRGHAGIVRIVTAPCNDAGQDVPDWLVVSIQLRLVFDDDNLSQDYRLAHTSLAEEGGSFISRTRLVETVSRYFLLWLHRWEEDGFKPVHEGWMERNAEERQLELRDGRKAEFIGLDENGAGIMMIDDTTMSVSMAASESHFYIRALDDTDTG